MEVWTRSQPSSACKLRLPQMAMGLLLLSLLGCQPSDETVQSAESEIRLIPDTGGVSNTLNSYLLSLNALGGSPYEATYQDLDADGLEDALVILQGPDWCSLSGCPLLIFQATSEANFRFLSRTERVRQPVLMDENRTNGWRNLIVGTRLKGRPEDVLLNYGLDGYPADAAQGERLDRSRAIDTQSAF